MIWDFLWILLVHIVEWLRPLYENYSWCIKPPWDYLSNLLLLLTPKGIFHLAAGLLLVVVWGFWFSLLVSLSSFFCWCFPPHLLANATLCMFSFSSIVGATCVCCWLVYWYFTLKVLLGNLFHVSWWDVPQGFDQWSLEDFSEHISKRITTTYQVILFLVLVLSKCFVRDWF